MSVRTLVTTATTWVRGKRAVAQPDRKSAAREMTQRICDYYGCEPLPPLAQKAA